MAYFNQRVAVTFFFLFTDAGKVPAFFFHWNPNILQLLCEESMGPSLQSHRRGCFRRPPSFFPTTCTLTTSFLCPVAIREEFAFLNGIIHVELFWVPFWIWISTLVPFFQGEGPLRGEVRDIFHIEIFATHVGIHRVDEIPI